MSLRTRLPQRCANSIAYGGDGELGGLLKNLESGAFSVFCWVLGGSGWSAGGSDRCNHAAFSFGGKGGHLDDSDRLL